MLLWELEVKNFYVEKEYRGTGIAQDLLNILVEFAKEKGYKRLELDSYKEFERAISFYEKNNFVHVFKHFGQNLKMIWFEFIYYNRRKIL